MWFDDKSGGVIIDIAVQKVKKEMSYLEKKARERWESIGKWRKGLEFFGSKVSLIWCVHTCLQGTASWNHFCEIHTYIHTYIYCLIAWPVSSCAWKYMFVNACWFVRKTKSILVYYYDYYYYPYDIHKKESEKYAS